MILIRIILAGKFIAHPLKFLCSIVKSRREYNGTSFAIGNNWPTFVQKRTTSLLMIHITVGKKSWKSKALYQFPRFHSIPKWNVVFQAFVAAVKKFFRNTISVFIHLVALHYCQTFNCPRICFSGVHNINSFRKHTKLFFTNKIKSSNSTSWWYRLDSMVEPLAVYEENGTTAQRTKGSSWN